MSRLRSERTRITPRAEAWRWAVLVLTSFLVGLVMSASRAVPSEALEAGAIAPRTVKAPFGFAWTDEAAFAEARRQARERAPVVFLHDVGLPASVEGSVQAAFRAGREAADTSGGNPVAAFREALGVPVAIGVVRVLAAQDFPEAAAATIVAWWRQGMGDRLVVDERGSLPSGERPVAVTVEGEPTPTLMNASDPRLVSTETVREAIDLSALRSREEESWSSAAEAVAKALVRPNLVPDPDRTAAAAARAEAAVRPDPVRVQRGETLFREGDRLGDRELAMLNALRAGEATQGPVAAWIATSLFALLLQGAFYMGARGRFSNEVGNRDLLTVSLLSLAFAALARLVVSSGPGIAQLVGSDLEAESVWLVLPVAGGAMLLRVLMGPYRVAIFTLTASSFAALAMGFDGLKLLYFVLTSVVGASQVVRVRERITVLRAGVIVGVFGALTALLLHVLQVRTGGAELTLAVAMRPIGSMGFALLGGVLSGFFVLAVIPIFEAVGFVTDLRMLELASLNHPLLRQLMLRAPGTYHHSVVVGTLAEAACDTIGANALQAKISAYFHDIGKTVEPRYFAENQRGANPHADLDPRQSAAVLIRHVTEGARMAREHRLPKPILDNILMHHGTGLIQYFHHAAMRDAADPREVDEALFRYPGPKPNTRESGVVMLADKVEAATRTIRQPTEESIRAMISRIIASVIADQQLTECPLTFEELHAIADTFTTVLVGIHHQRVEYPQTRSISTGELDLPMLASAVGTITMELEGKGGSKVAARARGEGGTVDEASDYESVRNLPQGDK